ncbi:MAG TPA: M4 family metallopeptidase [Holophagaceae bacterium]|nr:M4 family metallopeptidase [Holophagaceae bacterium]
MRSTLPRTVSALVLALAAGTGTTAATPTDSHALQLASVKSLQAFRAQQAASQLRQLRNGFGLDERSDFQPGRTLVNAQGRTVVRLKQTFDGLRVWGGEAIAHVEADGQVKVLSQGVKPAVALASQSPRLTADQARDLAVKQLGLKVGVAAVPKVEAVVFPTRYTGGITTKFDATKRGQVLDREMSILAKKPAQDYVQAYEVRTLVSNVKDGHKEITFIVDATTGAILRKWSALQSLAVDTPAQGIGHSYYRGTVPLSTTQEAGGTYMLRAMDRGTLPNPYVLSQGESWVGLTTCYGIIDWNTYSLGFIPYAGHATNEWGDGTVMPLPWDFNNPDPWSSSLLLDTSDDGTLSWMKGALTPAGETAAVDAHYGLSTTLDFYKNVFNRDGIDNQGTSTFSIVHSIEGQGIIFDNAYWDPWSFCMHFGEGAYPGFTSGMLTGTTEMDITGHELTHGVTQWSVGADGEGLHYWDQSGGLNEATSDMMGKMVQAYADGGGTGATVPNFASGDLAAWEVAHNSSAPSLGALRFMYKPSLDGMSTDNWYDGVELLDVHFSSGAPNRFFYFLSQGASANASSLSYSPYLPSGMTGLGNDKAARIWYKTLTEQLTSDADFMAARDGSVQAATDLAATPGSGFDASDVLAVQKAWAAVNVGVVPGAPQPVRISLPVMNPPGSFLDQNAYPSGILSKVQFFPTKTNVFVRADVTNTTDTRVDFSTPTWTTWSGAEVGHINPDGSWQTPSFAFYGELLNITATSKADPRQYSKGYVLLVESDADLDQDTDALDLGAVAMNWGLPHTPHPSTAITGDFGVGDWDVVFLGESLGNAFPAPQE